MTATMLHLSAIDFSYGTAPGLLFANLTLAFGRGWTGIVGANGTGKTTLVRLACGELEPLAGRISAPQPAVYCPQRTDDPPEHFAAFLAADGPAAYWRSRLGMEADWLRRWDTLSHGERKRAQLGAALWREPAVLGIDEPTNHLDRSALEWIAQALASFTGIGLLVSHDRELLDRLCARCVFIDPPLTRVFPGSYSAAVEQRDRADLHAARERERAEENVRRLERLVSRRRHEAAQSDHRLSGRHLDRHDHDGRGKLGLVRVSGKDGQAGRSQRQADSRLRQARDSLGRLPVRQAYELGIWFRGERSLRDSVVSLPAGRLPIDPARVLEFPDLRIGPEDRIALTGPNGAGKTTLLRHLLPRVALPPERVVHLPQEMDVALSREVLDQVRGLDSERLGLVMTIVSRLGSRPARLLESREPSPGELRKLLLALGIARRPHLIVMDEPTNHLDLPAITCLEDALADCPCALLLVSHDERFLRRLIRLRWDIRDGTVVVGIE
ncbi:MAG: ABC-F family ATP-binding cassette domain-containing protein [Myxococcales bacterium]|nr:ABC-F family ATP-binding cassette domain-containing protein [Myxococcales bacterium]